MDAGNNRQSRTPGVQECTMPQARTGYRKPRPDDLIVLLEVARSGTFSAAAATLGMDHSTVSRRISALENDVLTTVIVRSGHGCELTPFGRELVVRAEQIERALAGIPGTSAPEANERPRYSGLIRVLAPEAFGACFVAPVLARMHSDFPDVTAELVTATRPLVQGIGADIEIGVGDPASRRIESSRLAGYSLGLYAAPEYLARQGTPTTVAELVEHSLVYYIDALLRGSDLDLIHRLFPDGTVHVGTTSVYAQAAVTRSGGGIGLLPNFLVRDDQWLVRVMADQVDVRLHFTVALAPRVLRRPAAAEVMRRLTLEVSSRRREL